MISSCSTEQDEDLRQLIIETCAHPRGSLERQRGLNRIVGIVQRSGKIWRGSGLNVDDYTEALQQTWLYVCRNLCESITGSAYDPKQASITTWMNAYLKRRLQDVWLDQAEQRNTRWVSPVAADEAIDPIQNLPSPPDPPPILEEVRDWVEQQGEQLRRVYVRNRPDINCQVMILRRLPPETSWQELAAEYGVSISTLSSFYQRECLPRLLVFGQNQGYLEPDN